MITYTPEELREAVTLALEVKNTDKLPAYAWARIAKILVEDRERLLAELFQEIIKPRTETEAEK